MVLFETWPLRPANQAEGLGARGGSVPYSYIKSHVTTDGVPARMTKGASEPDLNVMCCVVFSDGRESLRRKMPSVSVAMES